MRPLNKLPNSIHCTKREKQQRRRRSPGAGAGTWRCRVRREVLNVWHLVLLRLLSGPAKPLAGWCCYFLKHLSEIVMLVVHNPITPARLPGGRWQGERETNSGANVGRYP